MISLIHNLNDMQEGFLTYQYRKVHLGNEWFVEVKGIIPADQIELNEILQTLYRKHGWPKSRQVIVGTGEEALGDGTSIGLEIYKRYLLVRLGPHREDVRVTPWQKEVLE